MPWEFGNMTPGEFRAKASGFQKHEKEKQLIARHCAWWVGRCCFMGDKYPTWEEFSGEPKASQKEDELIEEAKRRSLKGPWSEEE